MEQIGTNMKQFQLWKANDKLSTLFTLIDDEDFDFLTNHNWYSADNGRGKLYAYTMIEGKRMYIHNLLLPPPTKLLTVDHKNHNTLDNQRINLRLATDAQQSANRNKRSDNISGYKGVYWKSTRNCWIAQIGCKGIRRHLGEFATKEKAALAYNKAALDLFGEFALLNEVL
jgi:hypothetical protein